MRATARLAALSTALSLALGSLAPVVTAQTPPPPPPSEAPPPLMSIPVEPPPPSPSTGAVAGAVAVNVFRIPGKTLLCGFGSIAAGGLMLLTFGTQYRAAGATLREGCGGKWVVGPSDLDRDVDPPRAIFSGSHP